jgi:hypothetical protein
VATAKQWHWMIEAAQTTAFFGVVYVIIRVVGGTSYKPTIAMPPTVRIAGLVAAIALLATIRTWFYYYRKRRT